MPPRTGRRTARPAGGSPRPAATPPRPRSGNTGRHLLGVHRLPPSRSWISHVGLVLLDEVLSPIQWVAAVLVITASTGATRMARSQG
jgi:hypothetical protein